MSTPESTNEFPRDLSDKRFGIGKKYAIVADEIKPGILSGLLRAVTVQRERKREFADPTIVSTARRRTENKEDVLELRFSLPPTQRAELPVGSNPALANDAGMLYKQSARPRGGPNTVHLDPDEEFAYLIGPSGLEAEEMEIRQFIEAARAARMTKERQRTHADVTLLMEYEDFLETESIGYLSTIHLFED